VRLGWIGQRAPNRTPIPESGVPRADKAPAAVLALEPLYMLAVDGRNGPAITGCAPVPAPGIVREEKGRSQAVGVRVRHRGRERWVLSRAVLASEFAGLALGHADACLQAVHYDLAPAGLKVSLSHPPRSDVEGPGWPPLHQAMVVFSRCGNLSPLPALMPPYWLTQRSESTVSPRGGGPPLQPSCLSQQPPAIGDMR
jgi:hypothetical protein